MNDPFVWTDDNASRLNWLTMKNLDALAVEKKTASELAEMVSTTIGISAAAGERNDDDFDVLGHGVVVGRIMKAAAVPVGMSWMWTLAFGYHEDRTSTHGYEATRDAAMAAFEKSWRRE